MRRGAKYLRLPFVVAVTTINTTSCEHAPHVTPQLVAAYEGLAHPLAGDSVSANIDCYLDFSTGMGEGMRATAAVNDKLKNFLGGRHVSCFKVGASDNPPSVELSSPDANFVDQKNFKEAGSKLKIAVDRMTAQKNRVSFFITDFERVDNVALRQSLAGAPAPHPIDASAWAQNDFREWLEAGNQIDVFAVPFNKPDSWFDKSGRRTFPNWVYTIVLTPAAIVKDSGAFQTSVAGFLTEEYSKNPPAGARHFDFNANAITVGPNSKGANGNANESLVVQDVSTDSFEKGYEFYAFKSSDLVKFSQDGSQPDKRILKVRTDSHVEFLANVAYGIKVYDVTQPLNNLDSTLQQAAPEVKKDVETGKADTIANKPKAATYARGTPADSVFDVVYNAETHEVGIKLKPEYSGSAQPVTYKVDLVVASSVMKDLSDADSVFALQYAGGYRIRALGESIRLALRDVVARMNEKRLHTFYIDITP